MLKGELRVGSKLIKCVISGNNYRLGLTESVNE